MKKKIVSVMLAAIMTTSLLTACGGSKEATAPVPVETQAPAPAPVETQAPVANDDAKADTAEGEMVSDETFEVLQENYELLTQLYDSVAELYNSDEIAANPEIEDAMNQAHDLIEQMGEITQDTLTEDSAVELNDAMGTIITALDMIVDGMELADTADAAEGEMVSDETFALLQENYGLLTQLYDAVAETYNSDEAAANPEIEDAMNQAYDIIEQMGEITQDNITEEDAETLAELMVSIVDVLQAVVDEM